MSVTIIFESHATTFDNENHLSSGHNDVALSPLGVEQAKELGERRRGEHLDAIFCSDLERSYKTGEIAFGGSVPIVRDARLREVDYGDMTQKPADDVTAMKPECIDVPFPNGESYAQSAARMKTFLEDLARDYDGKRVMIIGHRATQYGLENLINGVSLATIIPAPWKWQPGWEYMLPTAK